MLLQAECEVLDRKMAGLRADMGEQAAEVHRSHKFNSGATEPTGDSSPTKLASGLLGTAEVLPICMLSTCVLLMPLLSMSRIGMLRSASSLLQCSHKSDSGVTEPTDDSLPSKLATGLLGTAKVLRICMLSTPLLSVSLAFMPLLLITSLSMSSVR